MSNGTQDHWYVIPWRTILKDGPASDQRQWCTARWGEPRGRDKDGIWNRTWEGYLFKNESDYMEFILRWL